MEYVKLMIFSTIAAALCAIGNRIRGGLWSDDISSHVHWGATTARIFAWGLPCMAVALCSQYVFHGHVTWVAFMMAPLMWIGATAPMFNGIDLGTQDGTFFGDFIGLTVHGVLRVLPACIILFPLGYFPFYLVAAGLLNGPCYVMAYRSKYSSNLWNIYANDRPPQAEMFFGALIGIAIAITFFIGPVIK